MSESFAESYTPDPDGETPTPQVYGDDEATVPEPQVPTPVDNDAESDGGDHDEDGGSRSKSSRQQRTLVRKTLAKAVEVQAAPPDVRAVAAAVLGCDADWDSLTSAIMLAARGASQPISDLNKVTKADPFEAAMTADALGRDRLRAVWALLRAAGESLSPASMPSATPKAALAVARVAMNLSDEASRNLSAAAELIRRS